MRVGVGLGREQAADVAYDELVLEGEIAASAVGNGGDALVELGEVGIVRRVLAHPLEDASELQAVLFARDALPARFDGKEPRDAGGDGDEVGRVVEEDEATGAQPGSEG